MNWMKYLLTVLALTSVEASADVEAAFEKAKIIPDVIDPTDLEFLKVTYGYYEVNLGNEITPTQTKKEPTVTWDADPNRYYFLAFIDLDVPSRTNHSLSEAIHWLVGNIPGNGDNQGETLAEYYGTVPPFGQGLERYLYLLYKQPGRITFTEKPLALKGTGFQRTKFSIRDFAKRYYLGNPIAGNFFHSQYDDTVNATLLLLYGTTQF